MTNKVWLNTKKEKVKSFINFDEDIISILHSRGIKTDEEIKKFLDPKLEYLNDEEGLFSIDLAYLRLKKSIDNKENVLIYGDYDVDGITSTSILYLTLQKLGVNVSYYIPTRDQGYGVSKDSLLEISKKNIHLIITVDCGITSFEEVLYAKTLGLDIIITDHHNIQNDTVPDAIAVINPKRKENTYPFTELAGVGTVYMFIRYILKKLNKIKNINNYLELVAIGTVSDLVSLTSDNRILVKHGLKELSTTKILGLKKLLNIYYLKNITETDISFKIAPLFNAAGRIDDAKLVVKLLISEREKEVDYILKELLNHNNNRKQIQENITKEVIKDIEDNKLFENPVIISHSPSYHHGVIGIVASKILDTYHKTSIIIEEKVEDDIAIGSCRASNHVDIQKALSKCSKVLVKFGGHKAAAGFTIKIDKIEEFKKLIYEKIKEQLENQDITKVIPYDGSITVNKISLEFINMLNFLKPFGTDNPEPIFRTNQLRLNTFKLIGKNQDHLQLTFSSEGFNDIKATMFNEMGVSKSLDNDLFYDILFKIKLSEYNDRMYPSVILEDIRSSKIHDTSVNVNKSIYKTVFPIITYVNLLRYPDSKNLILKFVNNKVYIVENNTIIGRLNNNLENLLNTLKNNYYLEFNILIKKLINLETGLYQVEIYKKVLFDNYSNKDQVLFNKIKKALLKIRNYNPLEKKVLSKIFKNKEIAIIDKGNINISNNAFFIEENFFDNLKNTLILYNHYKYKSKTIYISEKQYQSIYNKYIEYIHVSELKKLNKIKEKETIICDVNSIKSIDFLKKLQNSNILVIANNIENIDKKYIVKSSIKVYDNIKPIKDIPKNDFTKAFYLELPYRKKEELLTLKEEEIYSDNSILEYMMEEK